MLMPENKPQPRIAVEDLLQLKRAEKPDQAFWQDFDRQLQERRLRLLMDREDPTAGWARGWIRWSFLAGTPAAATAFLFGFGILQLPVTAFNPSGTPGQTDEGATASAPRPAGQPLQASSFGPAVTALAMDLPTPSRERPAELATPSASNRIDLMSSFVSFANDALSGEDATTGSFRKIMAPTSLVSEPRPSYQYVAEPLTSNEVDTRAHRSSELF
ncbi:MAG: hypothetical protein Q7P63_17655 [Verrucomicrobiota bacterium JB022]|nr:hypothetical protein [Verrucomicrobiota bacterium JB022]